MARSQGVELIATERSEQLEKHEISVQYDVNTNDCAQLSWAAMMLLAVDFEEGIDPVSFPPGWSEHECEKMINKNYFDRLVIAGALIAAELDRLLSISKSEPNER